MNEEEKKIILNHRDAKCCFTCDHFEEDEREDYDYGSESSSGTCKKHGFETCQTDVCDTHSNNNT